MEFENSMHDIFGKGFKYVDELYYNVNNQIQFGEETELSDVEVLVYLQKLHYMSGILYVITDYCYEMENHGKILGFLMGAALRPYIDRLNEEEQKVFMDEVMKNLEVEYHYQANGKILFPFKRLFLVGQK